MLGKIKENSFQKVALSSLLPNVINMIINIAQVSQFKIHALYIDSISFLLQKGQEPVFSNIFPPKKSQSKYFRQMNGFKRLKNSLCKLWHGIAPPKPAVSPQLGYLRLTSSGGSGCCG